MLNRLSSVSDRRVARQFFWMGGMLVVQFLASVFQLSLSARILGPHGYGVLAIIIAVTSLVYGFMSMPGSQAIVTFVARSAAKGDGGEAARILRFTILAPFALALISYFLLTLAATKAAGMMGLAEHHALPLLVYGVTGLFTATLQESIAVLRLADRMFVGFAVTALGSLTRVALLFTAWSLQGGLMAIILAYVAAAMVNGAGMLIAAALSAQRAGIPGLLGSLSVRVPSDVVRFQVVSFCQTKAGALAGNLELLLLGALATPAEVGLYRAARQIIDSSRLPAQPMAEAVQVEYSRQWHASDGVSIRRGIRRYTLLSVGLAAAMYLVLSGFHQFVIQTVLGSEFSGSESILLMMVPGAFVFMASSGFRLLPAAAGRAMPSLIATVIALGTLVITMLVLVPTYGMAGAAWSRTLYFLALVFVTALFTFQIIRQSRLECSKRRTMTFSRAKNRTQGSRCDAGQESE